MPSSHEIGVHFANIAVRNISLNSPFKNCLSDESQDIDLDWNSFKTEFETSLKSQEYASTNNLPPDDIIEETDIHVLKQNALVYYTGYCILKKVNCQSCREKLVKKDGEIKISETFLTEIFFNKYETN